MLSIGGIGVLEPDISGWEGGSSSAILRCFLGACWARVDVGFVILKRFSA